MKTIRFLWENLFDLSTTTRTASSEAADSEVENLVNRWHTRAWKSTGVGSEWIKGDLGSAQDIWGMVLKAHNFQGGATVKFQMNATDSWGSPSVDETISITTGQLVKFWDSAQNYRWIRVSMADAGNPDGFLKGGKLFVGGYFSPTYNFTTQHSYTLHDPSTKRYSSGGQISSNQKTHYRMLDYFFGLINSADRSIFESIFNSVGEALPYFLCQDADDIPAKMYYVSNTGAWKFQHIIMDMYFSLGFSVEEMR